MLKAVRRIGGSIGQAKEADDFLRASDQYIGRLVGGHDILKPEAVVGEAVGKQTDEDRGKEGDGERRPHAFAGSGGSDHFGRRRFSRCQRGSERVASR